MARGIVNVSKNGRGETLFSVHRWPYAPRERVVCASTCADQEGVNLSPEWLRPDDAGHIGRRLAASQPQGSRRKSKRHKGGGQTTGKAKGRVLYVIEDEPIGS